MSRYARWLALLVVALAALVWMAQRDGGRRPATVHASAADAHVRPRRVAAMTGLEELRALLPTMTGVASEGKPGVTGEVVDALTGQPLAGARVQLLVGTALRAVSASGPEGRFALELEDEANGVQTSEEQAGAEASEDLFDEVTLLLDADGYVPGSLELGPPEALATRPHHLMRLEPQARVVGRVIEADGTPVAGVAVLAVIDGQLPLTAARTDGEGHFELAELDPREHLLYAIRGSAAVLAYRRVQLRAGERAEVELVMRAIPTYELRVQVRDAAGAPYPHLRCAVRPAGAPSDLDRALLAWAVGSAPTSTDEEGRYAVKVGTPGWYELELSDDIGDPVLTTRLFASEEPREETFTVPAARVALACSFLDPEGQPVMLGSHSIKVCGRTSCSDEGASYYSAAFSSVPVGVVHFAVPRGAQSIAITLGGTRGGRTVIGTLKLRSPDEPCVIDGAYEDQRQL